MSTLSGPAGLAHEPQMLTESIWQAPLAPAAVLFTAGMALDRLVCLPLMFSQLMTGFALLAFVVVRAGRRSHLGLLYLGLAGVAFGCSYHHYRQRLFAGDDIGFLVGETPTPVRIRGVVDEEPRRLPASKKDPLHSIPATATASTLLRVTAILEGSQQTAISGKVRLLVTGKRHPLLTDLHAGDQLEVSGQLSRLPARSNPGEFDQERYWHDRGVHAQIRLREEEGGIRRLGSTWSIRRWLGKIRTKGHDNLERALAGSNLAPVARALLLGEGAPLTPADWAKYVRTGVVHVLAISGQHLAIVGLFLWWAARILGVRQRYTACLVAVILLGYALLTGAKPPALRAAIAASLVCLGLLQGRPAVPANLLAAGWLIVGLIQPADLFEPGCQLSFAAVVILYWGGTWWRYREPAPVERVVEETQPVLFRWAGAAGRGIYHSYVICFIVWLGITPLVIYHQGVFAPMALLLGPILTLLTSCALLSGFVVLLTPEGLAWLPGNLVHYALAASEGLVDRVDGWKTHVWVGGLPLWWTVIFYGALLGFLMEPRMRSRWQWGACLGMGWVCLGLLLGVAPPGGREEFRCTFLAVGHGSAIVLEFPDGRTALYDVGSLRGPEVTTGIVAGYLWSRKIARLDDVIVSHPDLDHFNGLVSLADRFAIGRVLTSDTFQQKRQEGLDYTLQKLRSLRWETLRAGDRLKAGGVSLEVLHPPSGYQGSNENACSLVLELRHGEHRLLLTGDLEREGLQRVLNMPPRQVHVLQAPHHGSARLDVQGLVRWSRPELVVSSQGLPRGNQAEARYRGEGVEYWTTYTEGAITIRSRADRLEVECYRHGKSRTLSR